MALGEPDRSPVEIWQERVLRFLAVLALTALYLVLFTRFMVPYREVGLPLAPLVALLYWRTVSQWLTGRQFELTLETRPPDTAGLLSLVFTVLYGINVLVFLTAILTWYRPEVSP